MGHDLKIDPQIERWAHMRENTHLYFNWSKYNTRKTMLWGVFVPVGLTVLAYATTRKWDISGAETKDEMTKKQ
ncbi:hypothetical protein BCR43DRAFT_520632 [Syncephalastrum racemosum]|uniref:Complex I-B15 n=1 Tax=Syncephalastrum racemosum TaxID=13706 RepID=A0A1X2HV72_SYNRA|nr:hypothetical protein BCR43DRAFT_520632 [Syncephalastrum racemosum]